MFIQQKEVYDAVVVGSGITGGWAAKELTEKGLNTLLLERGSHVEHGTDYITEHKPPWEMGFRGLGNRPEYEKDYAVQSQAGPFNAYNKHFFVKDSQHPYTFEEGKPYLWIRGYQLGGRSITWGRQCYRWSDLDFEANLREGVAVDWPIRYKELAPWYDYVERFVGVTGAPEGLPYLPDGQFLPPMPMNCVEQKVKTALEQRFPKRRVTNGRAAILTQPHNGRAACHYCGPCSRGCTPGAYFCSLSSTLPAAQATGNLTLRTDSIVDQVLYDAKNHRAAGVHVIDRQTHESIEFYGRVIFLCASALGSTKILLNSTSPRFPNGLANTSGVLGHYLMDHHFKAGAQAVFEGFDDKYYYGNRPNGIYIPRFRNTSTTRTHPDFLRGYGYQGAAYRAGWAEGVNQPGFGASLKKALRTPGPWRMNITGFGETLPLYENYVDLDPEVKDSWGTPALRFHVALSDNEQKMRKDMATAGAEMLEAAGGVDVQPYMDTYRPGEGIHEMGTARMGKDPKTSVLNKYNQTHDLKNLFVTDGACMTSSACQNPSITYMALTARACDYAVKEIKQGHL